jgi:lipooligosaccharide transport system ATP-binding protein
VGYGAQAMPTIDQVPVLEATGLSKRLGGALVVDGVDVVCGAGTVVGLLGPNGAGKTTTLRMLYGFLTPDAGRIRYLGQDFAQRREQLKRHIGVCTQDDTLDEEFTVAKNLALYAGYFRPRVPDLPARISSLIEQFGLGPFAHHRPVTLSGGYRRRLMIARAVVHEPRVLFLDEPTSGLDPQARVEVWQLIDRLRSEGLAIILTTHYMDEAERLSDRLLVLDRGRRVAEGAPREVIGQQLGDHVIVLRADVPEGPRVLAWLEARGIARPSAVLGSLSAALRGEQLAQFTAAFPTLRFTVREPDLDDLFMRLAVRS